MKINKLSDQLRLSNLGFWEAQRSDEISYIENGHELIKDCEEGSFWFRHRQDIISFLTTNYKTYSLLDVGGGNGRLCYHLQKKGINCVLIEPGRQAIINAQKLGLSLLINSSLSEAQFKDQTWESVGVFDVLEHIQDDGRFLKEIHRILKPAGRLFITVPAYEFLFSDFDREVGHFRRYTLTGLSNKLRAAGFEINYKSYLFSILLLPFLVTRFMFKKHYTDKQDKRNKEHFKDHVLLNRLLTWVLKPERWFVKWRWQIPFGTSCLVVAQKIPFNADV